MSPVQSFDRTGARELDREAILRNCHHESARPAGGCGFRDEWTSGLGGRTVPSLSLIHISEPTRLALI
eukprot:9639815-Alexandrium_andersonii.AAC.1